MWQPYCISKVAVLNLKERKKAENQTCDKHIALVSKRKNSFNITSKKIRRQTYFSRAIKTNCQYITIKRIFSYTKLMYHWYKRKKYIHMWHILRENRIHNFVFFKTKQFTFVNVNIRNKFYKVIPLKDSKILWVLLVSKAQEWLIL